MPKILFVSNTANFQKFNLPFMRWCSSQGWQVDYASPNDEPVTECDNYIELDMPRSPLHIVKILKTIRVLKKHLEGANYDIIHCHTPVGSVVARLAAKKLWKQKKIKVIYTAHGFHFFKDAPLLNWLIFYPVEKYLALFTDVLITINEEDYQLAKKKFRAKEIVKIDGVGVNLEKFMPLEKLTTKKMNKAELRKEYGYSENDFILLYIAEFIPRKNHEFLLNVIPKFKEKISELKVVLPGKGVLLKEMEKLVSDLKIEDIVKFLGYRQDINVFCQIADIYVTTSLQEGLPISVIEAMATGLPIVASNIRGHKDVVIDGKNGFLFPLGDEEKFLSAVLKISNDNDLRRKMSENNLQDSKKYSVDVAVGKMKEIYEYLIEKH